jgi:predicted dinucleotide-binding enzyme
VRSRVLTICGSGNAGHALAVVASQHHDGEIDWLIGSEEKAEVVRRGFSSTGLRSTGVITGVAKGLRTISADPAEVIPGADMILIVVPAYGHANVLRRIGPYVSDTATIGCLPTRGGFEFEAAALVPCAGGRRRIFGLQTLPWSTRVITLGEVVNIGAAKAEVVLAALPADDTREVAARVGQVLGTQMVPVENFLALTLGNPGQYIHPGLMYGHFRAHDGEEYDETGIPMFYSHASDEMGRIVEGLSDDAIRIARAIEAQSGQTVDLRGVIPVHEWLRRSYAHVTDDMSTVATCFRTGPIQARKAPMAEVRPGRFMPDFAYRYMTEDVPYGLVVTKAVGELAGVETPMIDEVVTWAQSVTDRRYLVGGKLAGPDAKGLPIPQNHGISTPAELIEWYGAS